MRLWESVATAAVLAAAPLAAQTTNQAVPGTTPPAPSPTPTPTPTPAPAPTGNAVGPPQLRDFTLDNSATPPAQPPTPTPTPTPSPTGTSGPAPTPRRPAATIAAPVTRDVRPPAARAPAVAAPDADPAADGVTVDVPPSTAAPLAPGAPLLPAPEPAALPASNDGAEPAWWPWLAALAAALGAGLLWWRQQRRRAVHAAVGAVTAPPAPVLPRAAADPAPRPAAPEPVRGPAPAPTTSAPAPVPAQGPAPAPAPAPAPVADGIVASRLKPELGFELVPVRVDTDAAESALLTFDLILINRGSAPARDVLVEVQLANAGPQVDAEVGRFFMRPAGDGNRLPLIAPMGRVSLRTQLGLAGATATPLIVEGRKLFVPVVAVNAFYRWSGGELRESASFLVGRGEAEGGKMAPFRLDLGARSWSQLGARLHSTGLQQ